jgi:membrane protease YdiL (CAAX protease family)
MLRGIYSYISNLNRLVLLITLVLGFMLFSTLFGIMLLVPFYGSAILSLLTSPDYNSPSVVSAMKFLQIMNMAGGLLLPAWIYLWLVTPDEERLTVFNKTGSPILIAFSIVLVLLAQPLIGLTGEINSMLALPEWLSFIENWMKDSEIQGELITEAFLATTSSSGLAVNIFMIAILPAFAEELLFRGVLASLFRKWTKNIHLAAIFSAFIFAAIHLQFYGFLPRFLLGIVFAYLFLWSGSLWLPIAAHFANNMLSVVVEFLFRKGIIDTNAENFGTGNEIWLLIISVLGVSWILYSVYNITKKNTNRSQ